jgi:hypothetical protein
MKKPTNFRLSVEARTLLGQMATEHGITATAMLEMLIREAAKIRHLETGHRAHELSDEEHHLS